MISGKGDRSWTELWKATFLSHRRGNSVREESLRLITEQKALVLSVLFFVFGIDMK